jgi:hypothetical protein
MRAPLTLRPLSIAAMAPLLLVAAPALAQQVAQQAPPAVAPVPYQPPSPVPMAPDPNALPAPPSPAGSSLGDDVIRLKDGGMMRGTIVEILPGDHATIVLAASGTSAIVSWAGIERIERIDRNRPPAPEAAPSPGTPAAPSSPSATTIPTNEPAVLVHIESKYAATLVRKVGDQTCDAPCDRLLPLNGSYRIVGPKIHSSGWFQLEGSPGDRVVIDVSPGLKSTFTVGGIIGGAGILAAVIGAYVIDIANVNNTNTGQTGWRSGDTIGGAMILGGLGVAAVGGVLMWTNRSSAGAQEVQTPTTEPPAEPPRREATWHAPDAMDRGLPRPQLLPILNFKF